MRIRTGEPRVSSLPRYPTGNLVDRRSLVYKHGRGLFEWASATTGYSQVELEDLRTFIAVADAGGLSLAARRLGVSKSIVSRRIFRLEEALGVKLLARRTRGACLTESGLTFREHACRVCGEMDIALETILPAGGLCGHLRIAAPLSLGSTHFAPVFAELARKHPRLQIQASYGDRFVDVVAEGFDCAVRVGHLPDSSLVARRIASVRSKLVASPDYIRRHGTPETPDELLIHETLLQGTEPWQLVDGPRTITVRPPGPVQSGQRSCPGNRSRCWSRHREGAGLSD